LNTVRKTLKNVLHSVSVLTCLFKGYAHTPYEWSPRTVDVQMFRVGNVVILIMPGEMTTMAGRRIRYVRRSVLNPTMGLPKVLYFNESIYNNGMALTLFHLYRNAIRARLIADGILGKDAYVVIAGPANTYAHYVTTREEYGVQRYEGASTLYGPS
jgi:neutral ceramidase